LLAVSTRFQSDLLTPSAINVNGDIAVNIEFLSNLDGNLTANQRPPIDAAFVLDISGSMSSRFPDDSDNRSKLEVAKDCILKISEQLLPTDRFSVAVFNDNATTIFNLVNASKSNLTKLTRKLGQVNTRGGTNLSLGLKHGYNLIRDVKKKTADHPRLQRVFFLTDMESTAEDEMGVIAMAKAQALVPDTNTTNTVPVVDETLSVKSPFSLFKSSISLSDEERAQFNSPVHLSVVGIGVDLSVATVESISAIPGARYTSVVNSSEFLAQVVDAFNYDITPIGFNISLQLSDNLSFAQVYGSAELNSLQPGCQSCTISTEFPVQLDEFESTNGGFYLCRLRENSVSTSPHYIDASWTDLAGVRHSERVTLAIPPPFQVESDLKRVISPDCDPTIRKALVLAEYVQCLTDYALDGEDNDDGEMDDGSDYDDDDDDDESSPQPRTSGAMQLDNNTNVLPCSVESLQKLLILGFEGIISTENEIDLPSDTPKQIIIHYRNAKKFRRLRTALYETMAICNDASLSTDNKNIIQTVEQVIELEAKDIEKHLNSLREKGSAGAEIVGNNTGDNDSIRGFMCPISLSIMNDPVIAADGHSYERSAITTWISARNGVVLSPLTNLPLVHNNLVPNHSLKFLIQQYQQQQQQQQQEQPAVSNVAPSVINMKRSGTTRKTPKRK